MYELPVPLHPFAAYKQFVLWNRDTKAPLNYRTGYVSDPHDPNNHLTAQDAFKLSQVTGYGVGFVFTDQDPFFFLDIDKCLHDSNWSPLAIQLCTVFSGCAVEISQSGKGLHIFGRSPLNLPHGNKETINGLELYTTKRYVALTGNGVQGSADTIANAESYTWLINTYFPATSQDIISDDWTDSPCGDWSGPDDDDELIKRMLKVKPSARSLLGTQATLQDLWNADEDALSETYPPQGNKHYAFDHSSADLSLCMHLAFWTGKNCERIDRLFIQSGLYRDKWDRPDYKKNTILQAVSGCTNVYRDRPKSVEPVVPYQSEPAAAADQLPLKTGYQFLDVDNQRTLFQGCIYVCDIKRVFTPNGSLLDKEQFQVMYGGYVFALDPMDNKATSTNAWKAFTESRAVTYPKVEGMCFRPEHAPGTIINDGGKLCVNTYVPFDTPRIQGDPTPFLKHVDLLFTDPTDRAVLIAYMAALVQYPGVKFQWAPLIQGAEGNGKTLFINCVAEAVGHKYTHLPNASDLGGNGSKFNAWLQNKLFIGVEEIYVSDRREVSDALKPLVTNERLEIQGKGANQITGDNRANFIMCSNHKDAILKTTTDRRYCVLYTAQQTLEDMLRDGMIGTSYFQDLYDWLKKKQGYAIVNDFLRSYQIPDELNPATECNRAPMTSCTNEAIDISRGPIEQALIEAIGDESPGFKGGWISSIKMTQLIKDTIRKGISGFKRNQIITSLGYVKHPNLKGGKTSAIVLEEGGRPRLYVKQNHLSVNMKDPNMLLDMYKRAQGYESKVTPVEQAREAVK